MGEIHEFLQELSKKLIAAGFQVQHKPNKVVGESTIFVQRKVAEVKIEINVVVRGSVYPPTSYMLCAQAIRVFKKSTQALCLNQDDVFAGKICAALSRQHPRDFFDMYMYFKQYTYTRELHQVFIVYLLSSNRPMTELIKPNFIDMKETYLRQFEGMALVEVDCVTLE